MAYLVNDKIELIAGDEAVIRFVGKTKLDDTIWYGIQYLSSKSVSKPTLITIHDIKSSNNSISVKKKQRNSNKPNKSISKSPQKLKSIKKTSSSIISNGTNNKSKISPNKKRSHISPKTSLVTLTASYSKKKCNDLSLKQKVNRSIAKKSIKNKEKKQRSSSAPSSKIKPYLASITDINNTLAMNDDFDNISSTIDSPESPKNKKKKSKHKHKHKNNKNKTHKRHINDTLSDLTKGILSSPSLSAKTSKKIPALSINSNPVLSINCNDNINSIGINFENQETQNMPSKTAKIGSSKSEESIKNTSKNTKTSSISKWDHEYEFVPIVLKSQTSSTTLDFAALIDDDHDDNNNKTNILTEEKEIEDDTDYKEQYAKIFSSIKTKSNKPKTSSLTELRRKSAPNVDCDIKEENIDNKKSKKKKARKRGQSSAVILSPPVTPRKKKENKEKKTGSLKKLKLSRTQSHDTKSKKKCDRNNITHGMFSYIKDITFNGKIVIGNRYLLKDDRYGICRYYGNIKEKEKKGKYIGIELEIGEGDNNGSFKGKIYFKCCTKRKDIDNDKKGLFVTKTDLKKDLGKA